MNNPSKRTKYVVVFFLFTIAIAVDGFSQIPSRLSPVSLFRRRQFTTCNSIATGGVTRRKVLPSSPGPVQETTDKLRKKFPTSDEDLNDRRYSASDWLHNMYTLPHSTVLRAVKGPVIASMAWSLCIALANVYFKRRYESFRLLTLSSTLPHAATASALGLLLVFRTNTAYQRFNEGRLIWEHILNVARNFTRLLYLYPDEISVERRQRMCRWVAAFPYVLHHHIDNRQSLPDASLLPPVCAVAEHRPLALCDALAREVTAIAYTDNYTNRERQVLLKYVDQLSTATDQCERIHETVTPVHYARHSMRAVTLWLGTLPLLQPAVWMVGWVAWVLLGIYHIGFTIEDPFQGSLRLAALCDETYRNIMAPQRASTFAVEGSTNER